MNEQDLIKLLIAIIGALICGFVGYFFKNVSDKFNDIKSDVRELKDMFIRHVRDSDIHVPKNQRG